jgi:hypothetical protein
VNAPIPDVHDRDGVAVDGDDLDQQQQPARAFAAARKEIKA